MHLSQPLVNSSLPDDWEVIQGIEKYYSGIFNYKNSGEIWEEVRVKAPNRFSGASYDKLKKERLNGLQWPVHENDTAILHEKEFRTKDGLGHFKYKNYFLRGMIKELLKDSYQDFYLTTGRVIAHYNNAAQTKESPKLQKKASEDVVLISYEDKEFVKNRQYIILVSRYGKSNPLRFKLSSSIKKGTLFVSFHHAKSNINYLFGDESDELTKTARFKSIKVRIE